MNAHIILFFGVVYHLRNPLAALERILSLAKDLVLIESFVCDAELTEEQRLANSAYMEFYETDDLGGQVDNWVGPTTNYLMALGRSAGFVRVALNYVQDRRSGVTCRRLWDETARPMSAEAPRLSSAVNNRTGENVFHPGKDEYICLYFDTRLPVSTRHDLFVEIDG